MKYMIITLIIVAVACMGMDLAYAGKTGACGCSPCQCSPCECS